MADVRVTLDLNDGSSLEVALTVDEAESLAEQLLDEAERVRTGDNRQPDMFKRRAH